MENELFTISVNIVVIGPEIISELILRMLNGSFAQLVGCALITFNVLFLIGTCILSFSLCIVGISCTCIVVLYLSADVQDLCFGVLNVCLFASTGVTSTMIILNFTDMFRNNFLYLYLSLIVGLGIRILLTELGLYS